MDVEFLGPLRLAGQAASLQRRDQVVLAALAVRAGVVMSADQLADALWGDEPPASWSKVLQGCVLRLRRAIGAASIETTPSGYRLALGAEELDSRRFERWVERARELASSGEPDRAAVLLDRALGLWRGAPFDVLDGWAPGRVEVARLEELRRLAEELELDARLEIGEHREVVAIAEARVAAEPLREHRWAALATALYRSGRQADALRALKNARRVLVEQLGVAPGSELIALEQAILDQDEALEPAPLQPAFVDRCPYKGLVPYDVDDTEAFFGRTAEIAACLERLRSHPVLVVTGPSGCGKSSLVRAGVVAALQQAGRTCAVFVPGGDPEAAMTSAIAVVGGTPIVVVDQLEETFTLTDGPADPAAFFARLARYATTQAPVVAAVRADHVAALAADPNFARLAEQGLHLVTPLAGESLRDAIEEPAKLAGIRLEHGLVDLLVRDCEGEPGALPLLSHALAETWQRRDGRVMTVDAYRATGEIRGAVARSADRLYQSLPEEQRPKLRSLLLRLVSPSPDGEPVRSRVAARSLGGDAERERVLGMLVKARLVTTEEDSVELAHEALARAWPRLRSWLDEDAAGQRILRHLSAAADGWSSLGRPASELYRGARLESALEWQESASPDLNDSEQAFLDSSTAAAASEREALAEQARRQARQNRRLRRSLAAVAVLLVAALVGGVLAMQQRQTAREERIAAERQERGAALTALTANAAALRTIQRDTAALLAVEAYRLDPNPASESALFGTFTEARGATRTLRTDVDLDVLGASVVHLGDRGQLATADARGAVRLIDLATGEDTEFEALSDRRGSSRVAVSSDERYLAVQWREIINKPVLDPRWTLVTVWDLETGERRFDPVRVPFRSESLSLSHDGSSIATSGGWTGTASVLDGATGALRLSVPGVAPPGYETDTPIFNATVNFRPDGSLVISSAAGPLRVIDPLDGTEIMSIDVPIESSPVRSWLTADGARWVGVGFAPLENRWKGLVADLESGTVLDTWTAPVSACNSWAFAERIDAVLCGQYGGSVVGFDVRSGVQVSRRFDSQLGDVCGLALTADGTRLVELANCGGATTLLEWRLDDTGPISQLLVDTRGERYVSGYGFAGDNSLLLLEYGDEVAVSSIVSPATGEVVDQFPGMYGLLPTGSQDVIAAFFPDDERWGLYDIARRTDAGPRVAAEFRVYDEGVAGNRLVLVGRDDATDDFRMQGIDLATGEPSGLDVHFDELDHLLQWVTATSEFAYTTSEYIAVDDGWHVERYDIDTGELLAQSPLGFRHFALGGGRLVANTVDGQIWELDPMTLQPIGAPFPGANGPVHALAIDDSGRRMVVRDGDTTTIRLYDIPSRTLLGGPIDLGNPDPYGAAALRADGRELAVVVGQGIAVWDLDPAHWPEAACALAGRNLTQAEWDRYIGDLAPYRRTCEQFRAGA